MDFIQKYKYLLLLLITVLAAFFRFHNIASNPPSLTWDEVAWGYNAYSLGIDGKDEFGKFLPLAYLESFGDYKPPVYAYLDIFPIKVFGLTEFAVRFPSAFLGTATVFITYFLVLRIFHTSPKRVLYALSASLLLAVSPWHIMLSRAAFEANVSSFFIVTGVWLYLKSLQEKNWWILPAMLCFVTSLYTFNSARIVSPLLVFVLSIVFYKTLWVMKKKVVVTVVLCLVLLLPVLQFMTSPQAKTRFNEVNIFTDVSIIEEINKQRSNAGNSLISRVLYNYRLAYAVEYLDHYLDHFNLQYLFINGDENPKFSTRDTGQMLLWELPFLIVGALLLFKKREGLWWIVPLWLFIGIIPAGTARETPHALRTEASLPMFQLLVAYGFINTFLYIKQTYREKISMSLNLALVSLLIFNIMYFYHGYSTHYANTFSGVWQYGYKDAFSFLKQYENKYDRIYFNDVMGRPYIYYLFYNQLSPQVLQNDSHVDRDVFGLVDVRRVGKYQFVRDLSKLPTGNLKILYVNVPDAVPEGVNVIKEISTLENNKQLIIYTMQ